jgi:hypothetical protein
MVAEGAGAGKAWSPRRRIEDDQLGEALPREGWWMEGGKGYNSVMLVR